jgi:hypothetical protein
MIFLPLAAPKIRTSLLMISPALTLMTSLLPLDPMVCLTGTSTQLMMLNSITTMITTSLPMMTSMLLVMNVNILNSYFIGPILEYNYDFNYYNNETYEFNYTLDENATYEQYYSNGLDGYYYGNNETEYDGNGAATYDYYNNETDGANYYYGNETYYECNFTADADRKINFVNVILYILENNTDEGYYSEYDTEIWVDEENNATLEVNTTLEVNATTALYGEDNHDDWNNDWNNVNDYNVTYELNETNEYYYTDDYNYTYEFNTTEFELELNATNDDVYEQPESGFEAPTTAFFSSEDAVIKTDNTDSATIVLVASLIAAAIAGFVYLRTSKGELGDF